MATNKWLGKFILNIIGKKKLVLSLTIVGIVLIATLISGLGLFRANDNVFVGFDALSSSEYASERIAELTRYIEEKPLSEEAVENYKREIGYMQYIIDNNLALEDIENLEVNSGLVFPNNQNKTMRPFLYIDIMTILLVVFVLMWTYLLFFCSFDNGMIKTILLTNVTRTQFFAVALKWWLILMLSVICAICIGFSLSLVGVPDKSVVIFSGNKWQSLSIKGIATLKIFGSIAMILSMASVVLFLGMLTMRPLYISLGLGVVYFVEMGIAFLLGQKFGEVSVVNFLPFLALQNIENYNSIWSYINLAVGIGITILLVWLARKIFLKRDIV